VRTSCQQFYDLNFDNHLQGNARVLGQSNTKHM